MNTKQKSVFDNSSPTYVTPGSTWSYETRRNTAKALSEHGKALDTIQSMQLYSTLGAESGMSGSDLIEFIQDLHKSK